MERAWANNIEIKILQYSKEKIWFLTKKWQTIWRENVIQNLHQYNKMSKQINRKNYVYNTKTNKMHKYKLYFQIKIFYKVFFNFKY